MLAITELLRELAQLGVKLKVSGDDLSVNAPPGSLTQALKQQIQVRKSEIISCLQGMDQDNDRTALPIIEPDLESAHQPFPLSDLQLGFYMANDPYMEYHVRPHCYMETDRDDFDISRYEAAWNKALARHHLGFYIINADLQLEKLKELPHIKCEINDFRHLPEESVHENLMEIREKLKRHELPLDSWPWFDLSVSIWLEHGVEKYRVHYNHNSFFVDGYATTQFLSEIERYYDEPDLVLSERKLSYRDAVLAIGKLEFTERGQQAKQYWLDLLPQLPSPPDLPQVAGLDRRRRSKLSRRAGLLSMTQWDDFKRYASLNKITPSNAVITIYAYIISIWSQSEHFIFSQMVTRRFAELHPEIKTLIGNFASLYPLEIKIDKRRSFLENATAIQNRVLLDIKHLHYGGMEVMQQLNQLKGSFGTAPSPFVVGSGLFMKEYKKSDYVLLETSQTLLDYQFFELEDGTFYYVWDLIEEFFPQGMMDSMWQTFESLLLGMCSDSTLWSEPLTGLVGEYEFEQRRLHNQTEAEINTRILHEPLPDVIKAHPKQVAVQVDTQAMNYEQLGLWSDHIADRLRRLSWSGERRVAIVMKRCCELPAAVMGVLKAGAAYVPIDPALPAARRALLINEIETPVVLTQSDYENTLEWPSGVEVWPLDVSNIPSSSKTTKLSESGINLSGDSLAYIIYTSGTTGRPKGVMIEHQSAMNTIIDVNNRFNVNSHDKFFGISAFNFDLSVYDIFGALAVGASLVYPRSDSELDPLHWLEIIEEQQITIWNSVPALISLLIECAVKQDKVLHSLRLVLLSGDKISVNLPPLIRKVAPNASIIAMGGATEASIWSIIYPLDNMEAQTALVPYGYPMVNQGWHIRDQYGEDVPNWVVGELLISGVGLARGYFKDEDKTSYSFITDKKTGERLYRTGDLGRYLPSGCIEILGRIDWQVKVQGHRIELGEIEAILLGHENVNEAVVDVREVGDRNAQQLVAYLSLGIDQEDGLNDKLQNYLLRELPAYMVPQHWLFFTQLPCTANGKIDRKALSAMPLSKSNTADREKAQYVAPSNEHEFALQAIWQEILQVESIGVTDDFFDLGGQSFDAIRIFTVIKEKYGRLFTLGDIWQARTIKLFASKLQSDANTDSTDPLVRITQQASARGIFLVHPAGGTVTGYMKLAHLLNRPVYGFQARWRETEQSYPISIEEIAESYLERMREVQPNGPYTLGGWSSGGAVAYEMARQLERQGETVDRVFLLDAPTPYTHEALSANHLIAWFMEDLALDLPIDILSELNFKDLSVAEQLSKAIERLQPYSTTVLEQLQLLPVYQIFIDMVEAVSCYQPDQIDIDLSVVRVSDNIVSEFGGHPDLEHDDWGWRRFTTGKVSSVTVKGNHHSFLAADFVDNVADYINSELPVQTSKEDYTMQQLLKQLSKLNIKLSVNAEGQLLVNAPSGAMTADLQKGIKEHKTALIESLQKSSIANHQGDLPQIVPNTADRYKKFPLNAVQHAYWIGRNEYIDLGGVSTHFYFELACTEIDIPALNQAFNKVITQHDMLRAVIDKQGQQSVLESVPDYAIKSLDLRGKTKNAIDDVIEGIRSEMAQQVIDCENWPLFEIRAAKLDDQSVRLFMSWDFLVVDAWSMIKIFQQWRAFYEQPSKPVQLIPLSFRDYVFAEQKLKETPSYLAAKNYWWERLQVLPLAPILPIKSTSEMRKKYEFTRRRLTLSADKWQRLASYAKDNAVTPSNLLLAVFSEVLNRWSKSSHYSLNLTLFNRMPLHENVMDLVGDFTTLMVTEIGRERLPCFIDRARAIQNQFLEDFEHREVSGVEVLREIAKQRKLGQSAIMPVVFTSTLMLNSKEEEAANKRGLEQFGNMVYGITQTPQVWLDCQIFEVNNELVINWDTVEELFLPGILDAMFANQQEALEVLASDVSHWSLDQLFDLVPAQLTVRQDNAKSLSISPLTNENQLLHSDFINVSLSNPDRTALIYEEGNLCYGELLALSCSLAEQLIESGVTPNQLVAIMMPKGWEQIAAVLGILLAGGAYLPVDPELPTKRRKHLLDHAEAKVVLVCAGQESLLDSTTNVEIITVSRAGTWSLPKHLPIAQQKQTDVAYVIYTSGSTGLPKGVVINHRSALNTIIAMNELFNITDNDCVLAVSSLSFDLSVYDIFGLLAVGGTIVIPPQRATKDPQYWLKLIAEHNISLWNSAPQLMNMLVDYSEMNGGHDLTSLRMVWMSGDWIPPGLPKRIKSLTKNCEVISLGGATEGAIWSIYYPILVDTCHWQSIPYGKALPGQAMYVLNQSLQVCPDYVTGDIYIGGEGVANGYWKDEERTALQFIVHPKTQERLYRTGDLGRYYEDGNIEFLGREDEQVKLHGHRIELGEITAQLKLHAFLDDAVVRMSSQNGQQSLSAYVVPTKQVDNELYESLTIPDKELALASEVLEEMGPGLDVNPGQLSDLAYFSSFWEKMERLCYASMLDTLQKLKLMEVSDIEQALQAASVCERYRFLVGKWISLLSDAGWIEVCDGQPLKVVVSNDNHLVKVMEEFENEFANDSRVAGFFQHIKSSLSKQIELLNGSVSPLELLFPEGADDLAINIYQSNPVAIHHNRQLAAVFEAMIKTIPEDRGIRILEVGAGTGATTASLLPLLPENRAEYWFTDLSVFFLDNAKKQFSNYEFVRYGLYNVDMSGQSQDYTNHSFDIVVAANVLHDAKHIDHTLGYMQKLLKPGGHLLMLEGTADTLWQWVTVGYLEGVGSYQDKRAESQSPVMSCELWSKTLAQAGFENTVDFPRVSNIPNEAYQYLAHAMPQHVIVARGPKSTKQFQSERLFDYLAELLPEYMLPQHYVELEKLPLTANGKINHDALPKQNQSKAIRERVIEDAKAGAEQIIQSVWKEVLNLESISVNDNFFDLGGDSLLLTHALSKINQAGNYQLSMADLFSYSTIRSLANYLEAGSSVNLADTPTVNSAGRQDDLDNDIAIIGMSGRFPDAENVDVFWENLKSGFCSVRQYDRETLLAAGVDESLLDSPDYVRAGVMIDHMDLFDAGYFGVTPQEAQVMDPQIRFLLECAVTALEHSGYPNEKHAGEIGVFVGKDSSQYLYEHLWGRPELMAKMGVMAIANVNEKDYAATQISYKLNLTGPSLNINTACSTSLVAIHQACQSLLNNECQIALAGGVSLETVQPGGYLYKEGSIASPDGFCRAFSDDAAGCIRGSGAGLVVLKPLSRAISDGDTIHAVLKSTAINNDGAQKIGYTAPAMQGQAKVIAAALQKANLSAADIQYVEAHGTGTHLGDPVEVKALSRVYNQASNAHCAIGSIKTNVGHLDAAAGVAGLIKTVQAIKHEMIPPSLHFNTPNPEIDFGQGALYVNDKLSPWQSNGKPRRAAVSSFGVGGTNAHVILEQAPAAAKRSSTHGPEIIVLSAKTEASLQGAWPQLLSAVEQNNQISLGDVAYTLQLGRDEYLYRAAFVCDSINELQNILQNDLPVSQVSDEYTPSVVFMFPGQGSQQLETTWQLYQENEIFKEYMDECAQLIEMYTEVDIRAVLYSSYAKGHDLPVSSAEEIKQTSVAQPVLFAVEYAMAKVWQSLSVNPQAMIGHSLGEYVAACLAGVFSLEEALSLVIVRSRLMQSIDAGSMLAVRLGEESLKPMLLGSHCEVATINGPQQTVVSGTTSDVEAFSERLQKEGIVNQILNTSHAFHSHMMEPILDTFEECVGQVELNPVEVPFVSNLTGTWISDAEAMDPQYWVQHLRHAVRFGDGLTLLAKSESNVFIEVGCNSILSALAKANGIPRDKVIPSLGCSAKPDDENYELQNSIALAWLKGIEIDWQVLHKQPRGRIELPTYVFDRQSYWLSPCRINSEQKSEGVNAVQASDHQVSSNDAGETRFARPVLKQPYLAPQSEMQKHVVRIWESHLGIEKIGINDNYFELGGNSVVGIQINVRMKEELSIDIPVSRLFELGTVRNITNYNEILNEKLSISALSDEEVEDILTVLES